MGLIKAGVSASAWLSNSGRLIARNSSGILYAVFFDGGGIYIRKSIDGGMTWGSEETIDTSSGGACIFPTIAIDSANTIFVAYRKNVGYSGECRVAHKTVGGSWSKITASNSLYGYSHTGIAIDSEDNIHVIFNVSNTHDEDVYYIYSSDGGHSWSGGYKVNGSVKGIWNSSIAIDQNDYPHIIWHEHDNGDLCYTYQNISGWHTETIASGFDNGSEWRSYWDLCSIAIDSSNYVHVTTLREDGLYDDDGSYWESVVYFNNRSGSWVEEVLHTGDLWTDEQGIISISISGDGHIRVFWSMTYQGNYKIALSINNGSSFTISTVGVSNIDYQGSSVWALWPSTGKLPTGFVGCYEINPGGATHNLYTTVAVITDQGYACIM